MRRSAGSVPPRACRRRACRRPLSSSTTLATRKRSVKKDDCFFFFFFSGNGISSSALPIITRRFLTVMKGYRSGQRDRQLSDPAGGAGTAEKEVTTFTQFQLRPSYAFFVCARHTISLFSPFFYFFFLYFFFLFAMQFEGKRKRVGKRRKEKTFLVLGPLPPWPVPLPAHPSPMPPRYLSLSLSSNPFSSFLSLDVGQVGEERNERDQVRTGVAMDE